MLLRIIIVFIVSLANAQTWLAGSSITDQPGTYNNSLGSENVIGSRAGMSYWSDYDGTWVFGGIGYGNTTQKPGYLNDLWFYDSISDSWTFVTGASSTNSPGNYDPLLGPLYPAARKKAIDWTTPTQFWLYGGAGLGGILNDLWTYSLASGEWQLIGGSQSPNQPPQYNATLPYLPANPGSRVCSFSWLVTPGKGQGGSATLWLYGGVTSEGTGYRNDMWKYNVFTNEWEWVAGSNGEGGEGTGSPPARACGASWVGWDGSLYLFGGHTVNTFGTVQLFNDIWKFDTTTLQWTLVQPQLPPLYTKTIYDIPAPRYNPGYTSDRFGNLYIFGGNTGVLEQSTDTRNDLWVYDVAQKSWRWILGSALPNDPGQYLPTRQGTPAARASSSLWIDGADSIWLFGGGANDELLTGFRNDLWILVDHFNPPPPPTPTSGNSLSTGVPSITGGPNQTITGPSLTSGQFTTGIPTTGGPNQTITTGPSTSGQFTTGSPTNGHPTTGHPTNGYPTITTGDPTSGNTAPPHHVSTGAIAGSVVGVTISAGVAGVLLYRGNLRFRNLFKRKDADDEAELLPINGSRRTLNV